MARRMFSEKIVGSDAFIEMPISSQALYFHLGMYADDDGFINPKKIVRMIGVQEDDLKVLIGKKFVLPFENGVLVIKHWKVNNLVRKDFYKETQYLEQKAKLYEKDNGGYTLDETQGFPVLLTKCQQNVPVGKDRLGKDIEHTETVVSETPLLKAKRVRSSKEYSFDSKLKEWENGKPEEKVFADFITFRNIKFLSEEEANRFKKTYFNSAKIIKKYPMQRTQKVFQHLSEKKGNDWSLWNVSSEISNQKYG